jgi:glycosyltransferase involved in cell wall biosynthesis
VYIMSSKPLFSIITINYNDSIGLQKTCESIYFQEFNNFEHIIIDGGSTDDSNRIIGNFSKLGSNIISEPDDGIYDAMNKGINLAQGSFIGFLNSGDVYVDEHVLNDISSFLYRIKEPEILAIFGNKLYQNIQGDIVRTWRPGEFSKFKYFFGWMTPHQSTFISAKCYRYFGLFNLKFKIAADYELMLRFFLRHGIVPLYIDRDIVLMQTGGVSNNGIKNISRSNFEVLRSWYTNDLFPPFWIFLLKPLSKIFQMDRLVVLKKLLGFRQR